MLKKQLLLATLFSACASAQTGNLNVTVQDFSGKAFAGAKVTIRALPMYAAPSTIPTPGAKAPPTPIKIPVFNGYAKTSAVGVATFASLPAGAYSVCAFPTGEQNVDSCSWLARPITAYVNASTTTAHSIKLQQAARVTVLVNDALRVLSTNPTKSKALTLGVRVNQGSWQALRQDSLSASARQLSLLVPVNTHLTLVVGASGLKVADSTTGKVLKSTNGHGSIGFYVPSTGAIPTLQLNVLGAL